MACGAAVLTTRRLVAARGRRGRGRLHRAGRRRRSPPALRELLADPARRRAAGRRRPGPGRRCSTGGPAPGPTWRATRRPGLRRSGWTVGSRRGYRRGDAPLRVVAVTYSPGEALDGFLTSLAAGHDPAAGGRARRQRLHRRRPASGRRPRTRYVRVLPTGGNVGYGAGGQRRPRRPSRPGGRSSPTPTSASSPVPSTSCSPSPPAGRGPRPSGRRSAPPTAQLYPSARDLPSLSTGIGHALLGWVWPANPWTARYRREREDAARAHGRLAVRLLLPRRPRGVPLRRRLRPGLLHVLRGRRPRRPARSSAGGCTSTRRRPSSSTRAATPPGATRTACSGCTTPARCATCPRRYPGPAPCAAARCAPRRAWAAGCWSPTSAPGSAPVRSRSGPPTELPRRRRRPWRRPATLSPTGRTPTCATQ